MPAAASTAQPKTAGRSPLVRVAIVIVTWLLGVGAFMLLLRVVWDAQEGWATVGLSVAAGALIYCLMTMYRMVQALGRPAIEFDLARTAAAASRSERYLREERRRLLRAINELHFDFEMGKLSQTDYTQVRAGYELQAVEVMRQLETGAGLHPEVVEVLAGLGLSPEGKPVSAQGEEDPEPASQAKSVTSTAASESSPEPEAEAEPEPESEPESVVAEPAAPTGAALATATCGACDGSNDADASFCKHCGKALSA